MSDLHGRFVWFDLSTTDADAARAFYGGLLGWEVETWDEWSLGFQRWKKGEQSFGSLLTLTPEVIEQGAGPHWMAYILVDDVKASLARAVEAGAAVYVPTCWSRGLGWYAILLDPQGGVFGLYTPVDKRPGLAGTARVPLISWHELVSADRAAAAAFYGALFGWESPADPVPTQAQDLHSDGQVVGSLRDPPSGAPAHAHWLFYIDVPDLDRCLSDARERGATVVDPPRAVTTGRVTLLRDPQGALIGLHERAS